MSCSPYQLVGGIHQGRREIGGKCNTHSRAAADAVVDATNADRAALCHASLADGTRVAIVGRAAEHVTRVASVLFL